MYICGGDASVSLIMFTESIMRSMLWKATEQSGTYITKDAKQYDPEDQYQNIPQEDKWHANYEWDHVNYGGESCQAADDFGVDL